MKVALSRLSSQISKISFHFKMAKTNHFRQIQSFKPDYAAVEIKQYESTRSGMRVVIVHKDGPKVEGTFILATEIHDDSGARKQA